MARHSAAAIICRPFQKGDCVVAFRPKLGRQRAEKEAPGGLKTCEGLVLLVLLTGIELVTY
jgi:hypothetical protein